MRRQLQLIVTLGVAAVAVCLASPAAMSASNCAVGDALRDAHQDQLAVKAYAVELNSGNPARVACAKKGLAALAPAAKSASSQIDDLLKDVAAIAGLAALAILAAWAIGGVVIGGATRTPKVRDIPFVRWFRRPRVFVQAFEDDSTSTPSPKSLASFVRSTLLAPSTASAQVDVLTAKNATSPLLTAVSGAAPSSAKPLIGLLTPLIELASRPVLLVMGTLHAQTTTDGVGATVSLAGETSYSGTMAVWATNVALGADAEIAEAAPRIGPAMAGFVQHRLTSSYKPDANMGESADGWALFSAAQVCAAQGDNTDAQTLCRQALSEGSSNVYARGLLAQLLLEDDPGSAEGIALAIEAAELLGAS